MSSNDSFSSGSGSAMDDESTIEEQEHIEDHDSAADELAMLQEEQDMSIEKLRELYGQAASDVPERSPEADAAGASTSDGNQSSPLLDWASWKRANDGNQSSSPPGLGLMEASGASSSSEEEILSNRDLTLNKDDIPNELIGPGDIGSASVDDLVSSVGTDSSLTNDFPRFDMWDDADDEEDAEYVPGWQRHVKEINVGPEYQAEVPDFCDPSCSVSNADGDLLWKPTNRLTLEAVKRYLRKAESFRLGSSVGDVCEYDTSPGDSEKALRHLLKCGHDVDKALRIVKTDHISFRKAPIERFWPDGDSTAFEEGLRKHGKQFDAIRKDMLPDKSVKELVAYYYFWKKTRRRRAFEAQLRAARQQRLLEAHAYMTSYNNIPARYGEAQVHDHHTHYNHVMVQALPESNLNDCSSYNNIPTRYGEAQVHDHHTHYNHVMVQALPESNLNDCSSYNNIPARYGEAQVHDHHTHYNHVMVQALPESNLNDCSSYNNIPARYGEAQVHDHHTHYNHVMVQALPESNLNDCSSYNNIPARYGEAQVHDHHTHYNHVMVQALPESNLNDCSSYNNIPARYGEAQVHDHHTHYNHVMVQALPESNLNDCSSYNNIPARYGEAQVHDHHTHYNHVMVQALPEHPAGPTPVLGPTDQPVPEDYPLAEVNGPVLNPTEGSMDFQPSLPSFGEESTLSGTHDVKDTGRLPEGLTPSPPGTHKAAHSGTTLGALQGDPLPPPVVNGTCSSQDSASPDLPSFLDSGSG